MTKGHKSCHAPTVPPLPKCMASQPRPGPCGTVRSACVSRHFVREYPGLPRKFPPLGEVLEKGEPISYTQWEAWLALYHSKVLLIAKATRACLCACGPGSRGPTFAKPSRACALSREKPLEIARGHCLRRSLAAPWFLSSPCAGRCNISSLRGGRARLWTSSSTKVLPALSHVKVLLMPTNRISME